MVVRQSQQLTRQHLGYCGRHIGTELSFFLMVPAGFGEVCAKDCETATYARIPDQQTGWGTSMRQAEEIEMDRLCESRIVCGHSAATDGPLFDFAKKTWTEAKDAQNQQDAINDLRGADRRLAEL